jgi:hypothetical protein
MHAMHIMIMIIIIRNNFNVEKILMSEVRVLMTIVLMNEKHIEED